ncbi:MAG TPA: hypothetical protein DDZ51_09460 [Planctomycetaceae bacterium]|nr:hypothetical protein [Planctomycetaceae bacterium]
MVSKAERLRMEYDVNGVSRERILEEVSLESQEIAERLVTEANQLADAELLARYKWAQQFRMFDEQRGKYGHLSFDQVARILFSLGQNPRAYLSVAIYVNDDMFADIVEFNKRESALGWRITWNHLEILARFGDPESRRALLNRCMEEKLNVEQLRGIASEMTKSIRS